MRSTEACYINKTYVEKLGYTVPDVLTWDWIFEVSEAAASEDPAAVEEELGDLLLTVTSLARKLGVDSERALSRATDKFIDRFERVEQEAEAMGKHPSELSMTELDAIWDRIKHEKM